MRGRMSSLLVKIGGGQDSTAIRRLLESGSLVEIIEILGQQNLEVVVDGLYSAHSVEGMEVAH